jgi:hypothetical protein
LLNGTVETLLSNEHLNKAHNTGEIHLEKHGHEYIIKIGPIQEHSAGLYSCEDDISLHNVNGHLSTITLHVISKKNDNKIQFIFFDTKMIINSIFCLKINMIRMFLINI